ncbi:L,D-transpeptidase [Nocardioides coralli]|uniref:L,D-transpeptidase n=1 Tax=Nocardioides coralli TaxID=2872154 RepID=UPI001CA40C1C|nr:Ig-like domain-containing protein [Nocardioides coralli]QZY28038.1 L,D-transpeptidase family protein [Nocardioides coralli]
MPRRSTLAAAVLLLASPALAGCTSGSSDERPRADEPGEKAPAAEPVTVTTNVGKRAVAVDTMLRVRAEHGTLRSVDVRSEAGRLAGDVAADGRSWRATERLEPGTRYRVRSVAQHADGQRVVRTTAFTTEDLTLDEQTFAAVAPLDGETVGVGMPVIVTFDVPVTDRASMQRHMSVTSTPRQPGTWHWVDDREAHWRPRSYWRPGTEVSVDLAINSVDAGNGIYGQEDRHVEFEIGDAVVSKVDVAAHRMRVFVNGELARTIPISAGKPGWETRSGTKVIMEKFERKRMNAETIGVDRDDPEHYDLANVKYAMRVTHSGEFLHAAPWSAGAQGSANVSHGCVGMSVADAAWIFGVSKRGDVVEVTGSDRRMTLYNGYGDWNAPFSEYAEKSAL